MSEPGPAAVRRVHPRLELPADDFLCLKAHAARRRTTLGRLVEHAIADWLTGDEVPAPAQALAGPTLRSTAALPEELHTRLKVRAAYARTSMQVLMRAALAPVLAEARAAEQAEAGQPPAGGRHDRRNRF